jgi:PAS domain-containing protein
VHPADFDRALDTYHAAFDARRSYEMEFRLQRDDGAWRWLLERGTPHHGPNGEFVGYIGTCIDITEHRETVEQLRENRARFKTLAESLPQMIWTCQRDGNTDYLSRQWLDYTGRSEAEQLGHGWLEQVHPDDRVKVQMEWARVLSSGDSYDLSYRIPPLRRCVSLVQDARGATARPGGTHPQVVRIEHRHRGFRARRAQAQGSAGANAAAGPHHSRDRHSPGPAQGV